MTLTSYGHLSFGEIPISYDHSVPNPFRTLLEDPQAQLIYLIELYPYNPLKGDQNLSGVPAWGSASFGEFDTSYLGGVDPVYLSDVGYTTKPTDSLPNVHFDALVNNPIQFDISTISGDDFGSGSSSFGSITIINGSGDLDKIADYFWPGRRVVVRAGEKSFGYDEFAIVFDGNANDVECSDDNLVITIRDKRLRTDQNLISSNYAGTGGLEGGDDLAGKPRPLCFGEVKNIEPVLVDAANLIYQVHDGAIDDVTLVRDSGLPLTFGGDVTDITVATVTAGTYKTQISGGYFRLGSTPSGRITADVRGDNDGGYVNKPGAITTRIVTTRLGARSLLTTEIDAGSLSRLDASLPGTVGLYFSDKVTASTAISALLQPFTAYWTFSRTGLLTCGLIDEPGIPDLEIGIDDIDEEGISRPSAITPSWRISVGYGPIGAVQSSDELAGSVTDVDRSYLSNEYRYVTTEDDAVYSLNEQAIERVIQTRLVNKSDAEDLLARMERIFSNGRRVFRIPIYRGLFRLFIGDTVRVTYPRLGLSAGVNLLVVGLSEDAETNTTTLELWG